MQNVLSNQRQTMNIIEYLNDKLLIVENYDKLKSKESKVYHIRDKVGEGNTNIYVLSKVEIESLEQAIMVAILNDEMKYGNYHYTKNEEREILELNIKELLEHYNTEFRRDDNLSLENIFSEYTNRYDKITMNYDWENNIEMEHIKQEDWLTDINLRSYIIQSKWNDVDYVFETENYFIRFNWATGA